jgi:prepilin-type N-terminal cleavage/methylation domain-containing protein
MKSAFTLVELAIVIVIIGLLVGGVLTGQELINQAKIRAQIKQLEGYNAAALTFKAKYGYIPGDVPAALSSSIGLPANASTTAGNGALEDANGRLPAIAANYEPWRFFHHLYLMGLIKAKMSSDVVDYSPGALFPEADIGKGGLCAISLRDGVYYLLGPAEKNIGNQTTFAANSATPLLSPSEAFALDQKLDDGIPSQGIIRPVIVTTVVATQFSNETTLNSCLGGSNQVYNLTSSTNLCRLVIKSALN